MKLRLRSDLLNSDTSVRTLERLVVNSIGFAYERHGESPSKPSQDIHKQKLQRAMVRVPKTISCDHNPDDKSDVGCDDGKAASSRSFWAPLERPGKHESTDREQNRRSEDADKLTGAVSVGWTDKG